MSTQATDQAQPAPGPSMLRTPPPPVRVFPFKPSEGFPDQLRPSPWSLPTKSATIVYVHLQRGADDVRFTVAAEEASASLKLTPDQAVCLAWQLMDAADQVNAGGAA